MLATSILLTVSFSLSAAEIYFPANDDSRWEHAPAGLWNQTAIKQALDFAGTRRSTNVVILLNGRILAERDWAPPASRGNYYSVRDRDGQILEDVASVQKSIASMLFGIARHKKLIDFDTSPSRYLGKGWTKAPPEKEALITMRHLLNMTSGLTDTLAYEADAGAKWRYNTIAYQKVMRILARASGKSENDLTREWLTGPIGMTHSRWQERPRMGNMLGFVTSARDLARFGLLVQNNGVWNRRKVIEDASYIREALQPSQKLNPRYGLLWWLNGGELLIPTAPHDLVAAQGALGRRVYVVPGIGIVAVRIGAQADAQGEAPFDREFWRLLMLDRPN